MDVTCYPETMPMSCVVKKTMFCFQSKAVYRAEDRPADIHLKMSFTVPDKGENLKFLILA